jgi:hypothetical protein
MLTYISQRSCQREIKEKETPRSPAPARKRSRSLSVKSSPRFCSPAKSRSTRSHSPQTTQTSQLSLSTDMPDSQFDSLGTGNEDEKESEDDDSGVDSDANAAEIAEARAEGDLTCTTKAKDAMTKRYAQEKKTG